MASANRRMMARATSIFLLVEMLCPMMWVSLTSVLWLIRACKSHDKIFVVQWPDRIEVHRPRHIQQDHRLVHWLFWSVISVERWRHHLFGVCFCCMLRHAGIRL